MYNDISKIVELTLKYKKWYELWKGCSEYERKPMTDVEWITDLIETGTKFVFVKPLNKVMEVMPVYFTSKSGAMMCYYRIFSETGFSTYAPNQVRTKRF